MEANNSFNENVLDWGVLNTIGLEREEMVNNGNLQTLLNGEVTEPVIVLISIMGELQEVEVTLQLQEEDEKVILQLTAVQHEQPFIEQEY